MKESLCYKNIGSLFYIDFAELNKCNTILSLNSLDENKSTTDVYVTNPLSSTITVFSLLNISNIIVNDSQGNIIQNLNSKKIK